MVAVKYSVRYDSLVLVKDIRLSKIIVLLSCSKKPMFDELKNYRETGNFFFTLNDELDTKCNAPSGKPGVFIIYVLKKSDEVELYYIGSSGMSVSAGSEIALQPNGFRKAILEGKRDKNLDRHAHKKF